MLNSATVVRRPVLEGEGERMSAAVPNATTRWRNFTHCNFSLFRVTTVSYFRRFFFIPLAVGEPCTAIQRPPLKHRRGIKEADMHGGGEEREPI